MLLDRLGQSPVDLCNLSFSRANPLPKTSDLKEPIVVAHRELGLRVGIMNPHPARRRSRDLLEVTFFKQIRESALRRCQFPDHM